MGDLDRKIDTIAISIPTNPRTPADQALSQQNPQRTFQGHSVTSPLHRVSFGDLDREINAIILIVMSANLYKSADWAPSL